MGSLIEGHRFEVIRHDAAATIELALQTNGVPSFSLATLDAFASFGRDLKTEMTARSAPPWQRILLTSNASRVFSMGGDIASIAALAQTKDKEGTAVVGEAVSLTLLALADGFGVGLQTVAIVTGRAFGFGFEVALACDRIVASPTATFGLPEGRFGLFAGMGATSLIPRRASKAVMERLVVDGGVIGAEAFLRLGIVDRIEDEPLQVVLEEGRLSTPADWDLVRRKTSIRRLTKRYGYLEIRDGLRIWEEAVLSMPDADIENALRIARMQAKRSG